MKTFLLRDFITVNEHCNVLCSYLQMDLSLDDDDDNDLVHHS